MTKTEAPKIWTEAQIKRAPMANLKAYVTSMEIAARNAPFGSKEQDNYFDAREAAQDIYEDRL